MKQKSLETSISWKISFYQDRSELTVITIPAATRREIHGIFIDAATIESGVDQKGRYSYLTEKDEEAIVDSFFYRSSREMGDDEPLPVIFFTSNHDVLTEMERNAIRRWQETVFEEGCHGNR